MPTRAIEPVRHAVRLQSLEPLEVEQAVVVRIARGVALAAGVAVPTGEEREEVRAPWVGGEEWVRQRAGGRAGGRGGDICERRRYRIALSHG